MLSREEARAFDRWAIDDAGIPSLILMENAGRGAARVLWSLGVAGPVVICCGKGNNGGDGLVVARHLANWGVRVQVILFVRPEELTGDAALHWHIAKRLRIPSEASPEFDEPRLAEQLAGAAWIVDALFGTGLQGPIRSPLDRVVALINASGIPVLAVDIPSGLDADTGEPMGATVRALHTVTFVAPKRGFSNPAASAWLGEVHVADIGVVRAD